MFDPDVFVAECLAALEESQQALAVKELLERCVSQPAGVEAAFGPPVAGFHTMHQSERLTVLQFVWPRKVTLYPHDHRMWAAIGIYAGGEDNLFYRRADGRIVRSGAEELRSGDTLVLGREAIHGVHNPFDGFTAAIHVYGGDFFGTPRSQWRSEDADEEPFDIDAVRDLLEAADGPGA